MGPIGKFIAWLFSAVALIGAGLLVWFVTAQPGPRIWGLAVVLSLVALAAAIAPWSRVRSFPTIGLLCLTIVATSYNALNYAQWYQAHDAALFSGVYENAGTINLQTGSERSSMSVPASEVRANFPLRLLTGAERPFPAPVPAGMPPFILLRSFGKDRVSTAEPTLSTMVAIRTAALKIGDGDPGEQADIAAQRYLTGGKTILKGQHLYLDVPACTVELWPQSSEPLNATERAVVYSSRPLAESCDKVGNQNASPAQSQRIHDFWDAVAKESALSFEMYDHGGRLILTATIPTNNVGEAMRKQNRMVEHIRDGNLGGARPLTGTSAPYSPFVNYISL